MGKVPAAEQCCEAGGFERVINYQLTMNTKENRLQKTEDGLSVSEKCSVRNLISECNLKRV